jgi:hypothetical protein
MHRVLDTPLFRSSGIRVRKLFLDIDDTTSPVYPDLKTEQEDREHAEEFGPKFQHIWTRMMETRTLNEIARYAGAISRLPVEQFSDTSTTA